MNNKKEKGITLIALVVTIVILLILAGISMKMVIGENGIIKKAKDARVNQVHSAVKEGIILSHNQYTIEKNSETTDSATFRDYIESKNIINEDGIINVVKLLGKKQHLGNGSNTETGDVYVFEETDDVYRVKYYDDKKEEQLIDEFEKGSEDEEWGETDPSYFEVDDYGAIHFKYEYSDMYYMNGTIDWKEENLIIPEKVDGKKVTKIEGYEFITFMSSVLKRVKIPDTVTYIENGAFADCSELVSVKLSSSLTSIGENTFSGCSKLASITIPEGVTEIGNHAFAGCNKLISITIPSSVATIGEGAFDIGNDRNIINYRPLESIKVSKENKNYDSRNDCNALIETSTNRLILGSNNTIIPDSIIEIGDFAFFGFNKLKKIIIPESVVEIGYGAFVGCSGLNSIMVSEENKNYDSRNGCNAIIETSTNTLILGSNNTIIPDSVMIINDFAFYGCNQLKDIIIPKNVIGIGAIAFGGCSGLNSIKVSEENKNYDSRNNCNAIIGTSTDTLINGCKNTTIPDSVTTIGGYAFERCSELKKIIIPQSVTTVEYAAFEGCTGLTDVTISGNIEFNADIFSNCTELISAVILDGATEIGDGMFKNCIKLKSVSIPNSVIKIGRSAFKECSELTSVVIPENVVEIEDEAFEGCTGLINVEIPESVEYIGASAFERCTGISEIVIPEGVTMIYGSTFSECTGLRSVVLPSSVEEISYYAFSGCCGLKNIIIPDKVTTIEMFAFNKCSSLKSVTLPKSIKAIFRGAFYRCSSLETTNYKGTEKEWSSINNWGNLMNTTIVYNYTPSN